MSLDGFPPRFDPDICRNLAKIRSDGEIQDRQSRVRWADRVRCAGPRLIAHAASE